MLLLPNEERLILNPYADVSIRSGTERRTTLLDRSTGDDWQNQELGLEARDTVPRLDGPWIDRS